MVEEIVCVLRELFRLVLEDVSFFTSPHHSGLEQEILYGVDSEIIFVREERVLEDVSGITVREGGSSVVII